MVGDSDPVLQNKTIAPTTTEQTITADDGYDGLSTVIVNGDSNLVPENIASGVSIFGVEGTLEAGSGGGSGGDVETVTGKIISAGPFGLESTIYYIDVTGALQSVTSAGNISVMKNSIIVIVQSGIAPSFGSSLTLIARSLGSLHTYYVTADFDIRA